MDIYKFLTQLGIDYQKLITNQLALLKKQCLLMSKLME